MRSVEQTLAVLERKLESSWPSWVAEQADGSLAQPVLQLALGRVAQDVLTARFAELNAVAVRWREFADSQPCTLLWASRKVLRMTVDFPTHLLVQSPFDVAQLVGGGWPDRLRDAAQLWARMRSLLPSTASPALLRKVAALSEVDRTIALEAAVWFRDHDAVGLTARQVPLAGVHAKWLDGHRSVVAALAGRTELGLVERPGMVRFAYLDPEHLRAGGRRYDTFTPGDVSVPCYLPRTLVICENKDTALLFPELDGAVAVFGNGSAVSSLVPQLPWIGAVPEVFYWGDVDARGLELLDELRRAGVPAASLLMDRATYDRFRALGTHTDAGGVVLRSREPRPTPLLDCAERELYEGLTSADWDGPRRVEQERIPFDAALAALRALQQG